MEIITISASPRRGEYRLFVTPGKNVEIHTHRENGELINVKVFRIGDIAEYALFNLSYTAPIISITSKNVIFDVGYKTSQAKSKRLRMEKFAWRNHNFDIETTSRRNSESMHI